MAIAHLPKICIVSDTDNWALYSTAKEIMQNLDGSYEVEIKCLNQYRRQEHLFVELFANSKYDLVHFLFRVNCFSLLIASPECFLLGENAEKYRRNFVSTCITTSICDHNMLTPDGIIETKFYLNSIIDAYSVTSKKLEEIYNNIDGLIAPLCLIHDRVDIKKFYPKNTERFLQNKQLVVGWVGNSTFTSSDYPEIDYKGFSTIIIPTIEQLAKEGYAITGHFADRNCVHIPLENMIDYYAEIDVLICASFQEATPYPVLEAMACGVPIISTDVGIVSEVFGNIQKEFIITRNTDDLRLALMKLMNNREVLIQLSHENVDSLKLWTGRYTSSRWKNFFDEVLSSDFYEVQGSEVRKNRMQALANWHKNVKIKLRYFFKYYFNKLLV